MDVRFDDLHHARYASCATDIHNLLYYTVDADIRRDHTVNLLAVYHDHFSKVSLFFIVFFDTTVLDSWQHKLGRMADFPPLLASSGFDM